MPTTFQTALRSYLLADSDITDIVGSSGVYAFAVAQRATLPYCMLQRISQEPLNNLVSSDAQLRELWQIDCLAELNATAEALADAVRVRLNNASPVTLSGFDVTLMIVDQVIDLSELQDDGSQDTTRRKSVQVIVKRTPTT